MSNIDKQALREAAEKATPGEWWIDSHGMAMVAHQNDNTFIVFVTDGEQMGRAIRHEDTGNLSHWRNDNDASFIAAANPATVLALLDELEALKLANAAQDDHINQQQDRIDLLEKGNNEAARQINSWRRLAKQNIAEREKDVSELNIARKRIAELEAREVKLPDINCFLADDLEDATLAEAFHLLAKGVRAADVAAIRRAGIRIHGEDAQ